MTFQSRASLHEKAVQKVAKESLTMKNRARKSTAIKAMEKRWSQQMDPLLLQYLKDNNIKLSDPNVTVVDEKTVIVK